MRTIKEKEKILIVGGTGFIGYHLIKEAKRKGLIVTSLSLHPPVTSRHETDVEYLFVDILKENSVRNALKEKSYDYVVNLGGYIKHNLFKLGGRCHLEEHFTGTINLVENISRDNLKSFIQVGSSDEYGGAPSPQKECMRESPISPYSLGKVCSAHFLQMLNTSEQYPAIILRLFLTYGPGQNDKRFIPQVINNCLQAKEFSVSAGNQLRDFCYVEDVVNAILLSLGNEQAIGQIFNVGSGMAVSIREVIELIREKVGKGSPKFGQIPYRPGENMSLYANIEKAKNILDWAPKISLTQGIDATINSLSDKDLNLNL